MAKTLKEAALTTREARKRLPPGVHWRSIDPDIHLGYRKGKRAGVWLVRWRSGQGYRQSPLGSADDVIQADNLDFRLAVRAAVEHVGTMRAQSNTLAQGPPLTVATAVEAYIEVRDARQCRRSARTVRSDAAHRLERYVIGRPSRGKREAVARSPLASISIHQLTERNLRDWRLALPERLKTTTVRRLIGDLKAALNETADNERDRVPAALPIIIKSGLKMSIADDDESVPVARENQILSDLQVCELLRAAREVDEEGNFDGDLYRLLVLMASTGARFSQVVRLRVVDVQCDAKRLMMPASRKGRGGKSGLTPIPIGEDVLEVIKPALAGRNKHSLLLERWRFKQRPGSIEWHRWERGGWRTPSEIGRPWSLIRDRVRLPEVVPYALRHSSIVRSIRANLPLRLVAALHDTSVAMIERHYARYIADGLDELAARAVVPLVAT